MSIAVIGAGSWGTAVAVQLAKQGYKVNVWAREEKVVREINSFRENKTYLPEAIIPDGVWCSSDITEVLKNSEVIFYAVPSHVFKDVLEMTYPLLKNGIVVNLAKGFVEVCDGERNTFRRMYEIFYDIFKNRCNYVVLSGPGHAEEVVRDVPTALVSASYDMKYAEYVQSLFEGSNIRVYTSPDVLGVELGGALKNIIAISTGIADGLGFGDNTRAALITRGLAEMTRLGKAMGANPVTFSGLSGLGDLIVTCSSIHSRNRKAGIAIGKGKSVKEAVRSVGMVVEGIRATKAAKWLAHEYKVDMPITEQTYKVLFENFSPRNCVMNLLRRKTKAEMEESAIFI
ncbi:NAD(P)H-dependent glycerol-3-phosphate dehydrogenase [Peptococcaceae bacterium]|nr:NAD(P)H-dependent glycerol-3-phosphate dehydrogenase [Peptococcaceae bacterium]